MEARPVSTRQPPLKARKKASTHTRPAIFSPLDAICGARGRQAEGQGVTGGSGGGGEGAVAAAQPRQPPRGSAERRSDAPAGSRLQSTNAAAARAS